MKKLFIGNWKMNGSVEQVHDSVLHYTNNVVTNSPNVILALPSLYLSYASFLIKKNNSQINLSAQDISVYDNIGPYTGEVSAMMLNQLNIKYCIIGHSERRLLLNEVDSILLNKLENCIRNNMIPIFCIGEPLKLRENKKFIEFLVGQLELLSLIKTYMPELIIAYEPIWSIGTGVVPTIFEIEDICNFINAFVQNNLNCGKIYTLYGGSVTQESCKNIIDSSYINGVLVGGASLKINDFTNICSS